jgi:PilZ domain
MAASLLPPAAPDDSEHFQQAPRFLPLETIAVRFHASPLLAGRRVFGIISDISETGACIISNLPLPEGIEVRLSIETRRRKSPLEVSARVVWCAERLEPIKEIVGVLTGVRFAPEAAVSVRDLVGCGLFQAIP